MSKEKIKQKLAQSSIKDTGWLEKAKWRQENEDWLDISFEIALRIGSTLSANKKANLYPKTQVELAEALGCSAQYVNKLLKGQENLQIDTICKLQRILGIKLIEVPNPEFKQSFAYKKPTFYNNSVLMATKTSYYRRELKKSEPTIEPLGESNFELAV